ncbi:alpha/beta fold hydrolase [Actinoplanes sp. M2I2]|uniref:alpha/beta fold hydrolase n=1 Tax=Actinoplanes sp. M2I2 TaxID=1734444 RepID=UPI0020203C4D|nr:alpha/beta hydrolase [Actinoplanes sp. M2I2]
MVFPWSTVGTVVVNGIRLGYRESGDPAGVPALLLHGTGSSASTWDRFAPRLAATGHRVIAVDLRGHATSARTGNYSLDALRDDVLGLLGTLELRDAVLVGHSVGAYAALAAAQHAPDAVARLVLEDLAAPPRLIPPLHNGLLRLAVTAGGLLTARRDQQWGVIGAIVLQLLRPDPAWWARLADVRQPTLVLSGGPSSCIPPRRLADVTAALPDARLATIPVGHRVHSLAPEQFHAEVLSFLTEPASRDLLEAL